MTMSIRSSVSALACLALASAAVACQDVSSPEAENVPAVDPVLGELDTLAPDPPSWDPNSTACPPSASANAVQKRVTAIAAAFAKQAWGPKLKGYNRSQFMVNNPCTGPDPIAWAEEIDFLMFDITESFRNNEVWVDGDSVATTVCGKAASKRPLKAQPVAHGNWPNIILTPGYPAGRIEEVGRAMNACWGTGHRPFLYLDTEIATGRAWIDPEPVRLTANLTGTAGTSSATAAGVFVNNTSVTTQAIKWPIDGSASTLAQGGQACSTASAASTTTLYKSIVVSPAGWRECK